MLVAWPVFAAPSNFRVWGGPIASYVPPDAQGKPLWSWQDKSTMLVHVTITATGGSQADETSGVVKVQCKNIQLCYRMRPTVYPAGQPTLSVAYMQVLEYTIPRLSITTKYDIAVQRDCQDG